MSIPHKTSSYTLMIAANVFYSVGAYVFDWNETHVKNPKWPPHARFHNGQTMTMGVLLASTALYRLYCASRATRKDRFLEYVLESAIIGSFYCVAGFSAILYPGTAWKDPDTPWESGIQIWMFGGQLAANWLGYLIAYNAAAGLNAKTD